MTHFSVKFVNHTGKKKQVPFEKWKQIIHLTSWLFTVYDYIMITFISDSKDVIKMLVFHRIACLLLNFANEHLL